MINIRGEIFSLDELNSFLPLNEQEKEIAKKMAKHLTVYYYPTVSELHFEIEIRLQIIKAAHALFNSRAEFATFYRSRCNDVYWELTTKGGFQLKQDAQPAQAVVNIFKDGTNYAFECATAMMIVFYKAVLEVIGAGRFNNLFRNLLLWDWNYDPDLDVKTVRTTEYLPGDVLYFKNPDVHPKLPHWQGENAVNLGNGSYYGHGIGIESAEKMIEMLNKQRKPEAEQSAYLLEQATRPNFRSLYYKARRFNYYIFDQYGVRQNGNSQKNMDQLRRDYITIQFG
ncbi:protein-glutamine gamma-glutamyltransferase [Bacillus taeanensis]|uniref:Protein-glutamine gamma-glutamyltransferase n=1 Tax=Bacillus taeanensis TaxID=273032 RepID=A0A366XW87_9BACI|nr:protein-glutamine gamma-glutamyltransferase [Bacillus taeanensis]RBW70670.1 protein-glutamine gamma-glutamyltransferase [Bacillus taeanensis]